MSAELEVTLHGAHVGVLSQDQHGRWRLRFARSYRDMSRRPVLGRKFEEDLSRAYRGKARGDLPPFFANLIPESGELRPLLERTLNIERDNDVALLEALGADLPGAVEVRRMSPGFTPAPAAAGDDSVAPTVPHDLDEPSMRFSLAGVQLKFSVQLAEERLTLPAHGELGGWIVKLDSRRFPQLCANEYAIMSWAKLAGFDVPECLLMPASALLGKLGEHTDPDARVLVVRRYDRNGDKIHQEDFAQVTNLMPHHKYDHVSYEGLAVLVRAIVGDEGFDRLLRRFAFMIASGNADAHLKNWSLIYPDRIRARLAPMYDQVATVAWPEAEVARQLALNFAGVKSMSSLDTELLRRFADKLSVPPERVMTVFSATFERLAAAWKMLRKASHWSMPPAHVEALREHWSRVPMLRETKLARM